MTLTRKSIQIEQFEVGYLEAGDGPLVVLLHGFPDSVDTWEKQVPALVDAGYRVLAPGQRGYPPSGIPKDGRYDLRSLGRDLVEFLRKVNDGEPAHVIGHDIGGIQLSSGIAEDATLFASAVWLNGTHPMTYPLIGLTPELAHYAFHIWLFGQTSINQAVAIANDMEIIDYLWDLWTPDELRAQNAQHIARVRAMLAEPGVLGTVIQIYPNLVPSETTGPHDEMREPVAVPSLLIHGALDPTPTRITEGEEQWYRGEFRRETIPGAKHWVHRDKPEDVNALLIDWLDARRSKATPPAEAARA